MFTLFRLAFRLAVLGATAGAGIMAVTLATVDLSAFVAEFSRSLAAFSGQPLAIAGGASVQYLPRPAIVMENVTVGAAGDAGVARTPRLVLEMDPADLALGELSVDRVVAEDPDTVVDTGNRGSGGNSVPPLSQLFGLDQPGTEVLVRGGRLTLVDASGGNPVTIPLGGADGGGVSFGGNPGSGLGGGGAASGGGGLPGGLPCP